MARAHQPYRMKKQAARQLRRFPLCAECGRNGLTVAADECDHIVPIHIAPDRMYDPTNLQSLCTPCHRAKSAREDAERQRKIRRRIRVLLDGTIIEDDVVIEPDGSLSIA